MHMYVVYIRTRDMYICEREMDGIGTDGWMDEKRGTESIGFSLRTLNRANIHI